MTQNEPDYIECLRIVEAHYADKDEDRTFMVQILLSIRDMLRKHEAAKRLEHMSVYDLIEMIDRPPAI